jgi:hypothetical protein
MLNCFYTYISSGLASKHFSEHFVFNHSATFVCQRDLIQYPLKASGKFCKHTAMNRRATIEILLETLGFCVVHVEELQERKLGWPSQSFMGVCEESTWACEPVRSLCQGMASEDIAGWKKLSGCCGDLWIVEISSVAGIACSSELCVKVVNKSFHQSKPHL